jgi:hypothetical protein
MGRDIISNLDSDATDATSLANRLNAITNILDSANARLIAIQGAVPPGPPGAPQVTALNAILAQTTQLVATTNAILSGGVVIGPQ